MELMRLNKFLASRGICSRREADTLIEKGLVLVNGVPAQMGMLVDGSEEIFCEGKRIGEEQPKVVLLYHKPAGVTCTRKDAHAKRTIETEINYPVRVTYAGRLDKESEGLLLLTNDGDLIEEMMRGANGHEKEYEVWVNRPIQASDLKEMAGGVYLEELDVTTRPCKVRKTGEKSFRIVLTQGLNRQIRRMCEALGYRVSHLVRYRVVNLELGDLPKGQYREATAKEVEALWKALRVGAGQDMESKAQTKPQTNGQMKANVSGDEKHAGRRKKQGNPRR